MPNDFINGIIQAWGLPVALVLWMIWDWRKNAPRKDPTEQLIDTLKDIRSSTQSLDSRQDEMNERIIRLETKMEMMIVRDRK